MPKPPRSPAGGMKQQLLAAGSHDCSLAVIPGRKGAQSSSQVKAGFGVYCARASSKSRGTRTRRHKNPHTAKIAMVQELLGEDTKRAALHQRLPVPRRVDSAKAVERGCACRHAEVNLRASSGFVAHSRTRQARV